MLNLGCGDRYHKDWINLDMGKKRFGIISHNLISGIPFPENMFDVVYHSHVLEHFSKSDGKKLIEECYRILKPGGIIRIAVPDLEQIIKLYTKNFNLALNGDQMARQNYDWIMLEMYDQSVRHNGGGEMKKYLNQKYIPNEDFVRQRVGKFFDEFRKPKLIYKPSFLKSFIKSKVPIATIKNFFGKFLNIIFGLKYKRLGKFRLSGEIHQWMYDKFSLSTLLSETRFKNIRSVGAEESSIKNWKEFCLDADPDGSLYKADSLYMEAIK
jgi:predicted SAM-dependent methyltransferase